LGLESLLLTGGRKERGRTRYMHMPKNTKNWGNIHVDYGDLAVITDNWLRTDCTEPDNCERADFEPTDGVVNLYDFSDFATQWLWCNNPNDEDCGT
jgi:hypothetical protein